MKSSTKRVNALIREAEARWTPEQEHLASILREAGCDVFAVAFVSGGASVTANIYPEHAVKLLAALVRLAGGRT